MKSPTPKISVIIPTFNYGHFIINTVDSVISQLNQQDELLIIDDGSTDNTPQVINNIITSNKEKKIRYFSKHNGGAASARNYGLKQASNEFIVLLDADDTMLPGALNTFRAAIKNDISLVIGGYISRDSAGNSKTKQPSPLGLTGEENFSLFLQKRIRLSHGRFLAKKELLLKSPYPEHLKCMEDQSVFSHLLALGNTINIDHQVVQINHHDKSLRNSTDALLTSGTKVVDAVFNKHIIPEHLFGYRKEFYVDRCLSIFRRLVQQGKHREALGYYHKAIKKNWVQALKFRYLKRAVTAAYHVLRSNQNTSSTSST